MGSPSAGLNQRVVATGRTRPRATTNNQKGDPHVAFVLSLQSLFMRALSARLQHSRLLCCRNAGGVVSEWRKAPARVDGLLFVGNVVRRRSDADVVRIFLRHRQFMLLRVD